MTNIYGIIAIYIFLFLLILYINYLFWFKGSFLLAVIGLIGMIIGASISINNLDRIDNNRRFIFHESGYQEISCRISDIYKESAIGNDYICSIESLGTKKSPKDANILVRLNPSSRLKVGQSISFKSKVQKIMNPEGYDYENYLLLKGVYGTVRLNRFDKDGISLNNVDSFILGTKAAILKIIEDIYPGDSKKLLAGIFLGIRGDFSEELKTNFNRSGLSHIVAVSGYNITILIIFMSLILKLFPDYIRISLTLVGILIFVMLVGNNSSAIRAAIMGIIAFLAVNHGRKINIYSVMVLTIIFFILWNPLIINHDIGFHLSFLALLGLVSFGETFTGKLSFLPEKLSIRESIGTTLAVLLFTLPIMLVNFGAFSIISPISNLLATPLIPFIMLFGFISIVIYHIFPMIGIIIGFIAYILLELVLKIVNILGDLEFSVINVNLGGYRYYFMIIYYVLLMIFIAEMIYRRSNRNRSVPIEAS